MSDKSEGLKDPETMQKDMTFYSTFLNAWVANRMEVDKQLLTLSALAIGLQMFFYDKLERVEHFVLWLLAVGLFISTIVTVLLVFSNNSKYIECMISERDQSEQKSLEKKLQRQTTWAFMMFIAAITMTFVLAIFKSGFIITKAAGG